MTEPAAPHPMPFDLWWSPSLRRFLSRHENQDDEHLVWVFHGHHEALRHYLGAGLDSNPPLPDDAVRLVLADPAFEGAFEASDRPEELIDKAARDPHVVSLAAALRAEMYDHHGEVLPEETSLDVADGLLVHLATLWPRNKEDPMSRRYGGSPTHGIPSTYKNYRCRCEPCTNANAEDCRRRRRMRQKLTPPPDAHGKHSTYKNWMCRCEPSDAVEGGFGPLVLLYAQQLTAPICAPTSTSPGARPRTTPGRR